jgi:purine-binding chemotaxis protein CheW
MSTQTLHVIFKVGDTHYALPASEVVKMESYTTATPVPGAAQYVAGLVQIHGRVIPVIDLRARFGLPPIDRGIDARVIVVKDGERQVGLLADVAREVMKLDENEFAPPPDVVKDQANGFVSKVARAGQRMLMQIDFSRVIGNDGTQEQANGKA